MGSRNHLGISAALWSGVLRSLWLDSPPRVFAFTLNPLPSTLNPLPPTLNPPTLILQPSTLNPYPQYQHDFARSTV